MLKHKNPTVNPDAVVNAVIAKLQALPIKSKARINGNHYSEVPLSGIVITKDCSDEIKCLALG